MDDITLTGERRGAFSQLFLRRDAYDPDTATVQASLDDIYDVFIELSSVLATVDPTSSQVVSSQAIVAYVLGVAAAYRRLDTPIPMVDVDQLIATLNTFRLKAVLIPQAEVEGLTATLATKRDLTDETFVNLVTDTLSYDSGTDLKTRLAAIDSRQGTDESLLSTLSETLVGSNILGESQSWTSWVAQHVMNWGADAAFKQGMLHRVVEHCCDYVRAHYLPMWHWQSSTTTSMSLQPDTTYVGHATRNIRNRFVYKAHTYVPVATDMAIMPTGDMWRTDFIHVYDGVHQELRNGAAFMLGKVGTSQEGTFLVKQIDDYWGGGDVSSSFPDDPLAIATSTELLEISATQATLSVPLTVMGVNILSRIRRAEHHTPEEPIIQNIVKRTTRHFHQSTNVEHHDTYQHVVHKTVKRYDQFLTGPDSYFTYVAPATNHTTRQSFNTLEVYHDHLYAPTKVYKTITQRIVPNWVSIEPVHILQTQRWNVPWSHILERPELYTKTEVDALIAGIIVPPDVVTDSELTTALADYTTTTHLTQLLAGKEDVHDHSVYPTLTHLAANHHTKTAVEALIGQRLLQSAHDAYAAATTIALDGKAAAAHDHSQYVEGSTLTSLLSTKVDYTSLGATLQGYQQHDDNHLKFVAHDTPQHGMRVSYQAGGTSQLHWLATSARTDALQAEHSALNATVATLQAQHDTLAMHFSTLDAAIVTLQQQVTQILQELD